jgi:hypothetical protein
LQITFSRPQRLDFRALQHDSRFNRIGDEVVMPRFAVLGNAFLGTIFIVWRCGLFAVDGEGFGHGFEEGKMKKCKVKPKK